MVDVEVAFFSEETGVDWNVIFLLLGMMIIVSVLKQTGVFDYLAIWASKRARGQPFAVMVLLVVHHRGRLGAARQRDHRAADRAGDAARVRPAAACHPVPFLLAEVLASNIGGTATLIGDPPNIIIAQPRRSVIQRLRAQPGTDRRSS